MAKKKSHKKQSFKYGEASATTASAPKAITAAGAPAKVVADVATATYGHPYLSGDMRRLAVVGGGLVIAELVLWYLFGHTGLGTSVYNLYHIGS